MWPVLGFSVTRLLLQNVRGKRLEGERNSSSLSMSASNMYRTGDYVYVDAGPVRCLIIWLNLLNIIFFSPFGVRRIDELQKSASGNVEMEVNFPT